MYEGLHVKCPMFFSDLIKFATSRQVFEKSTDRKLRKIPSVGADLFPVDGQT